MLKLKSKKIGQLPWKYTESMIAILGIILFGFLMQWMFGSFNFDWLSFPNSLFIAFGIVLFCLIFGYFSHRKISLKWFSDVPMSVCLISSFVIFTLVMGIVPQREESLSMFGWDSMTGNWSFVLIYFVTLLSLGTLIVRRMLSFCWRDLAFYANHIGVWLFLFAAGLGAADMERYVMDVNEGETVWHASDEKGYIRKLPIAIHLNNFDMDVYPPKLVLVNRQTGEYFPKNKPLYFQIDNDCKEGDLCGWRISVLDYKHQAVAGRNGYFFEDSTEKAMQAVLVQVSRNDIFLQGWITNGNVESDFRSLQLNDSLSLMMAEPEPRGFVSDIKVYTDHRDTVFSRIEVNKQVRTGSWNIYQYGYDIQAGRNSSYSTFLLVRDPWLPLVYFGIILIALGSVSMIWTGRKKRGGEHDVE